MRSWFCGSVFVIVCVFKWYVIICLCMYMFEYVRFYVVCVSLSVCDCVYGCMKKDWCVCVCVYVYVVCLFQCVFE